MHGPLLPAHGEPDTRTPGALARNLGELLAQALHGHPRRPALPQRSYTQLGPRTRQARRRVMVVQRAPRHEALRARPLRSRTRRGCRLRARATRRRSAARGAAPHTTAAAGCARAHGCVRCLQTCGRVPGLDVALSSDGVTDVCGGAGAGAGRTPGHRLSNDFNMQARGMGRPLHPSVCTVSAQPADVAHHARAARAARLSTSAGDSDAGAPPAGAQSGLSGAARGARGGGGAARPPSARCGVLNAKNSTTARRVCRARARVASGQRRRDTGARALCAGTRAAGRGRGARRRSVPGHKDMGRARGGGARRVLQLLAHAEERRDLAVPQEAQHLELRAPRAAARQVTARGGSALCAPDSRPPHAGWRSHWRDCGAARASA